MDSLTLFGHLFKTRCEAICIFLDFFTEKRGSHREIYNFFRKNHETHCICKRFSIYCNKNCSGNMQILCPFAETTYTPSGDENIVFACSNISSARNNLHPVRGRKHILLYRIKFVFRNNLRPVRGRKLVHFFSNAIVHMKQLTPRQGTKTPRLFRLKVKFH